MREKLSGQRIRLRRQVRHAALRDQRTAAFARARPDIDDVIGTPNRIFVMLDHHQRIALFAQLAQRVQQNLVVARMQADGRFVEHVAHALQVAAELRGEPDTLRFAARQARRRAIETQITEPDFLQKLQTAADFANHVARDFRVAARHLQCVDPRARVGHGPLRDVGNRIARRT